MQFSQIIKADMFGFRNSYPKTELDIVLRNSFRVWELLIGIVLLVVIGFGLYQYWKLDKLSTEVMFQFAKTQSLKHQHKPNLELGETEKVALNDAYLKLNYSWDRPFKALEKAKMPEVSILEVQPDIDRMVFKVVAQSTSLQTMLDYTKKLREQPFVRRVVLDSKETQEDPTQPIVFGITLTWY